jgi:hypothetical protein
VNDTESIYSGTEFSSLNEEVRTWEYQMELDPPLPEELVQMLETSVNCQEKSEEWQHTDTVAGAFRDPSLIESCFECIHFIQDIFQTLLAPFITSGVYEDR